MSRNVGNLNCHRANAGLGKDDALAATVAMHNLKTSGAQRYAWDLLRNGMAHDQPNCTARTPLRSGNHGHKG